MAHCQKFAHHTCFASADKFESMGRLWCTWFVTLRGTVQLIVVLCVTRGLELVKKRVFGASNECPVHTNLVQGKAGSRHQREGHLGLVSIVT